MQCNDEPAKSQPIKFLILAMTYIQLKAESSSLTSHSKALLATSGWHVVWPYGTINCFNTLILKSKVKIILEKIKSVQNNLVTLRTAGMYITKMEQ